MMKAIILAAGRGSRMRERTEILPKCLTELWGKTLLDWQLKAIEGAGIRRSDIAIITGYHAEKIREAEPDLHYFHNERWAATNMVSTLMEADEWLNTDTCIVSYADIVYTRKAISLLMESSDDIAITYYTKFLDLWKGRFENPLDDIETFKIDKNGFLTEIGQKAKALSDIEGQYMGLLRFTPEGYSSMREEMKRGLPKPMDKMDMTGLLSYLLGKGIKMRGIAYDELWIEMDSQDDLALYESWDAEKYIEMLIKI